MKTVFRRQSLAKTTQKCPKINFSLVISILLRIYLFTFYTVHEKLLINPLRWCIGINITRWKDSATNR